MRKRLCTAAAALALTGCSVADIQLADEAVYNDVYKAYKNAEENKNPAALRAVAQEFLKLSEKYPASGTADDAFLYRAKAIIAAVENDTTLTPDSAKSELRQAEASLAEIPSKSSKHLASIYYSGYAEYRIWGIDSLEDGARRGALDRFAELNSAAPKHDNTPAARYYSGQIYRKSDQDSAALIWFDRAAGDTAVSSFGKSALFWGAVTRESLKKYREAEEQYNLFLSRYENDSYRSGALFGSAYSAYLQGDSTSSGKEKFESGKTRFDQFVKSYGSSDSVDNARLYGGHCYRKTGDRLNAAAWYEAGISAGDGSKKGDCVYWAGVLYDQLNNSAKQKQYLELYIAEYDKKSASFDEKTYYDDAKKRMGL